MVGAARKKGIVGGRVAPEPISVLFVVSLIVCFSLFVCLFIS